MRKRIFAWTGFVIAGVIALTGCIPNPPVTATPTPVNEDGEFESAPDISGLWVGGFGPVRLVAVDIKPDGEGYTGRVRQYLDSRNPVIRPTTQIVESIGVEGSQIKLLVADGELSTSLSGTVEGNRIVGVADGIEEYDGAFELHRIATIENSDIGNWEGVYQLEDDPVAVYRVPNDAPFAPLADFWVFNLNSGTMRALYALSANELLIGSGVGVVSESEGTIRANRGSDGAITSLTFARGGQEAAAEGIELATEEVVFQNGDLKLAGRITLPPGSGPHPAVVIVHGSEPGDRDNYHMIAAMYATHGVVAFTYDKRGVGDSDGVYIETPSDENITNLAGDALAAVEYLKTRTDIVASHLIGLAGGSQAGWVIPEAAARSQDVSFVILISGPVVSTNEESMWSSFTNNGGTPTGRPLAELEADMADLTSVGFNSAPFIEQLQIPGLWLFGTVDRSVPAKKSAENLASIKERTGGDFTIVMLDNADHLLLDLPDGMNGSLPFSNGFVPGYFRSIQDWLASHVVLAGP